MTPEEIAILAIVVAALVSIGGIFLKHWLDKRQKKAKIDYSIFYGDGGHKQPYCVLQPSGYKAKTAQGDMPYYYFTVSSVNRGDINGFINIILHSEGAKVFSPAMEEPSPSSTQHDVKIVNNGKDIVSTFYIIPDPGAEKIRLHVTATPGKSSEVQAPYDTHWNYYNHNGTWDCNPPPTP